jgi:peptide/nickel transport system substrate-binding protein
MSIINARRMRASAVAVAAGALVLTACSSGGGGGSGSDDTGDSAAKAKASQSQIAFGDAKASQGPAPAVPGAKTGGVLQVLQRDSYAHLDPAQIYVSDQGTIATILHRGLVEYKMDGPGKYSVVGDLATDTGTPSDGGRTWKFTLKDGVKWEDGTEITSKDVRHTFERLFAPFITQGPVYIQQWLADTASTNYRKLLPDGPFKGKHLPNSILSTPDDKTIVFHFKQPHPDLPYALAMPGYGIVDAAKDTKQKYDKAPVCAGPYKIKSFKPGKSMVLVKNTQWDPKTDPARHQYLNGFNIEFGHQFEDSSKRLLSDSGQNQETLSLNNQVDAATLPKVFGDPSARKRTVSGYQPYVGQVSMNMTRIKDMKIRKAITLAMPIKSILQAYGGPAAGELAGGLISPTLSGYHKGYDPYGKLKKPQGDPVAAKKLLQQAGKVGMKLTYAYINTPEGQQYSVAVQDSLNKAGFNVQRKELPADTYYDLISRVKNNYDIYGNAWGADWPSASTVIPPLYDGRQIQDGAANYSHINDPHVNSEIDRINKITDQAKAADAWWALNRYIMEKVLPVVPTFYYKQVQLYGSKVGGVVYNDMISSIDPTRLFLKS